MAPFSHSNKNDGAFYGDIKKMLHYRASILDGDNTPKIPKTGFADAFV